MLMQSITQRLANPTRFMQLSGALLPLLWVLAGLLLVAGIYLAAAAPPDYQHGHTVKIMFVHVPSAWIAMLTYAVVAVSSFGLLVFRHPLADVSAKAAAPIGATFTLLALVTGSLWGKPGWGTYWVWDARLTSVLVLFFLYLGLIALRSSIEDESLAGKLTAVLALMGTIMLPIIKYSVEWWSTLHQPSTGFGSSVDPSLRWPLLVMVAALSTLFLAMHMKGMRNEVLRRRVKALMLTEVERASSPARRQPRE
jgi:heme exporter protein C